MPRTRFYQSCLKDDTSHLAKDKGDAGQKYEPVQGLVKIGPGRLRKARSPTRVPMIEVGIASRVSQRMSALMRFCQIINAATMMWISRLKGWITARCLLLG